MDKLEKALQKARLDRQKVLSDGQPSVDSASAEGTEVQPLPAGTVALSAIVLEQNRIFAHQDRNVNADLFRILRTQVLQAMAKYNFKTLAITSPNYGDGKTTMALNLCISIAQDLNQTVLLADLDLRKPCLHTYLGLTPASGLTDYLAGTCSIADSLLRLPFERMTILPAGKVLDRSSETLGSPQMVRLADELKTRYADRLVVYDMPPLLAQDDPLTFLPHIDAVLLVVRDGVTKTADIKRCLDILSEAKVIGIVLNDAYSVKSKEN